MALIRFISLVIITFMVGCSTTGPDIFKKKSLHDQYASKIKEAGLDQSAMGKQWLGEAEKALSSPHNISLPYKETGYFSADHPRAVGLNFNAKSGEKLLIDIERNPKSQLALFADLWLVDEDGKHAMLLSLDTAQVRHEFEVDKTGTYVLRLQPELLSSCDYTLSISVGPTLLFPIASKDQRIGSIWGDERDAGARSHEGIDLFAPKRTPVIAAADGVITRVNENRLGGKVVWQRPKGKNLSLYYAHLDEQLVTDGQQVKAGDTIGLVGNTGNARTTPPHLHFGIYTFGGAVDPLPFVNPVTKNPLPIPKHFQDFKGDLRIAADFKLPKGGMTNLLKNNTLVKCVAINGASVRVLLPDSMLVSLPYSKVEQLTTIQIRKLKEDAFVFESPQPLRVKKTKLSAGAEVSVLAYFGDYIYIKTEAGINGWIPAS